MSVNENSITVKYSFGLEISVPLKKMLLLLCITLLANTGNQEKISEIVYKPSCSSPVPSGTAEASPSVVPIPSSNLIALPVWGSGPFAGLSPPVERGMNKFLKNSRTNAEDQSVNVLKIDNF